MCENNTVYISKEDAKDLCYKGTTIYIAELNIGYVIRNKVVYEFSKYDDNWFVKGNSSIPDSFFKRDVFKFEVVDVDEIELYIKRSERISQAIPKISSLTLLCISNFYVVEGVVIKANGVDPATQTFRDIHTKAKPENRFTIQNRTHLECHFPNSERDKVERFLDEYCVPKGFTYTLYSCDTLYSSDKE